ncbi:MAG: hypothetical protein VB086_04615 [Clostridiaceae bacterium]|nr:hypothetical protein [Clostridiaceae bacterium]
MEYLLLPHPAFARLFSGSAEAALAAETAALLGLRDTVPRGETLAGVSYYVLSRPEMTPAQHAALARSAAFLALYSRVGDLLRPEDVSEWHVLPDMLPALLKYQGKTNERFTRFLVNLAQGARRGGEKARLTVLDPMCGQGTTLFEAAVRGWDAIGLEALEPPARKGAEYFVKFLENGRYKHKKTAERRSEGGKRIGTLTEVRWAANRGDWETENTRTLRIFCAEAQNADRLLSKKSADLLVCDLPYGVQHGGREGGAYTGVAGLLRACLPHWVPALRPGAGVALAYNTLTARRDVLCTLLTEAGFSVDTTLSGGALCHRVDQAITRDVIIASYK